jgi:hypothetical protein
MLSCSQGRRLRFCNALRCCSRIDVDRYVRTAGSQEASFKSSHIAEGWTVRYPSLARNAFAVPHYDRDSRGTSDNECGKGCQGKWPDHLW